MFYWSAIPYYLSDFPNSLSTAADEMRCPQQYWDYLESVLPLLSIEFSYSLIFDKEFHW